MSSKKKRNPKPLVPKKSAYRPLWITLGVLAFFGAIIAAFTFSAGGMTKGGEVPAALSANGGVIVTQDNVSDEPAQSPVGPAAQPVSDPAEVIIVQDYNCIHCGEFEEANHAFIDGLLKEGAATVEYRPVAIQGDYSSRAANAAVCVATENANAFYEWNGKMFEQGKSGVGLTDDEILAIADEVGVNSETFVECVERQKNDRWVAQQSIDVFSNPLAGSAPETTITGTPGVFVNGKHFQNTPDAFPAFFASAVSGEAPAESTEITVPGTTVETESPAGE